MNAFARAVLCARVTPHHIPPPPTPPEPAPPQRPAPISPPPTPQPPDLYLWPDGQWSSERWIEPATEIPRIPAMADIRREVCLCWRVTTMELTSQRRMKRLMPARQAAYYLMRTLTPASLPQIGRSLGNRDHTTVMHGVRVAERRMERDPEFARLVEAVAEKLRGM